jgi:NAD(P)-dependent dehydrogenase (short-subunit alcohol dehydrogenase family)
MSGEAQLTRVALVTGASRGLGAAAAGALAASGAHVVLAGRNAQALEAIRRQIVSAGGQATAHAFDLKDGASIDAAASELARTWGRLDVLISNAAVLGPMRALSSVTDAAWLETIDTNLTANWRLLRSFDPLLRRSPSGRVVVLTSSAAVRPKPQRGPYAVSKAGLEMLAKTYALETAETAVRVTLLDPGAVNTDMRAGAVPGEDRAALPQPQDIAPLIVELSAPTWHGSSEPISYARWRARAKRTLATA